MPHIRDVCDRFAADGFVALAPDLYHGRDDDRARRGRQADDGAQHGSGRQGHERRGRLPARAATRCERDASASPGSAWAAACAMRRCLPAARRDQRVRAVLRHHPVGRRRARLVEARGAAVLGHFAEKDAFFTPESVGTSSRTSCGPRARRSRSSSTRVSTTRSSTTRGPRCTIRRPSERRPWTQHGCLLREQRQLRTAVAASSSGTSSSGSRSVATSTAWSTPTTARPSCGRGRRTAGAAGRRGGGAGARSDRRARRGGGEAELDANRRSWLRAQVRRARRPRPRSWPASRSRTSTRSNAATACDPTFIDEVGVRGRSPEARRGGARHRLARRALHRVARVPGRSGREARRRTSFAGRGLSRADTAAVRAARRRARSSGCSRPTSRGRASTTTSAVFAAGSRSTPTCRC